MSQPFLGQISVFGFNFAPLGWATCSGQILPISQYTALFSLIGTYYGGNGTSTFQLPNMQGTVAVGQGQLPGGQLYDIGEIGGANTVTLQGNQGTMHAHSLMANAIPATASTGKGNVLAQPTKTASPRNYKGDIYNPNNLDTTLSSVVGPAGASAPLPHNNVQPVLALNYCIALSGIFPQRS
jgi:microcystin-dependent protein